MSTLLEKLNEMTDNEFDYLKLSSVDVAVKSKIIDVRLLYPADKEKTVLLQKEKITQCVLKILKSNATVNVRLKKSHFDFEFFKVGLFSFLTAYPSIGNTITDRDVLCQEYDELTVVTLVLEKSVYDYCVSQNILADIERFIDLNYCEDIKAELLSKEDTNLCAEEPDSSPKSVLEFENSLGRLIRPVNVEDFVGRIVYEPAGYIEDATVPRENAVLCGTVGKLRALTRKPKAGEAASDKKYYKFVLTDYTGTIGCVYFPSKKTQDQMTLLVEGKQIVARGTVEEDTYKKDGSMTYRIRDISLCTLPEDFLVNRIKRKVPELYTTVFPQPYTEKLQTSLFDADAEAARAPVAPFVLGKTFCVFDLETTGFSPDFDKIIEIGAVKMIDGKVTETFSTFVDPLEPLSDKIRNLTHIEDCDLAGQPHIEQVLPDFYKFSYDTILVGQNVQFDYSFISSKGKTVDIFFDNERMDTLSLARKYFPNLGRYKLEALAKYFGVVNKGAHRAIYDAWATAEIFLEIAKMIV